MHRGVAKKLNDMLILVRFYFVHSIFVFNSITCASLLDDNIKQTNYHKNERPYYGETPVNVTVQAYIHSIGPIDEADFTFEAGFYLRQWWTDPRLSFNSSNAVRTTSLSHLIWIPNTSVADCHVLKEFQESVRTVVEPSGEVYLSRRLKAVTSCEMNLKYYPMETQTCHLMFETFAFTPEDIELFWHDIPILRSEALNLDGYELILLESEDEKMPYLVGNKTHIFKQLKIHFFVKRTIMFHIYRTYIPSVLLLAFAFGTFWVPDTAVPARMGMIVTSFLASIFILQAVSEKTVKVSYTTPMQMFLVVNITIIVCAMVEYIVVLQLKRRKKTQTIKSHQNGILNNGCIENGKLTKMNNLDNGFTQPMAMLGNKAQPDVYAEEYDVNEHHWIDKFAQTGLPLLYLIFCGVYFGYYLTWNSRGEEKHEDH